MEIKRRKTKKIYVGNVAIGGDSPVSIQSMTRSDTRDVKATVKEVKKLESAGCEIIRVAVLDEDAAKAIKKIKAKIKIPLVADIHFNYKLAIMAVNSGADKIRLNPGNITKREHVEAVIKAVKQHNIPIRIGLNSGSVKRTADVGLVEALVSNGLKYLEVFKNLNFENLIFSLKTHDVLTTIEAYRRMSKLTDSPMHIGLTATGLPNDGIIKTSIGAGVLLTEGIGDTLRVSLTADPVQEVLTAKKILNAVELRKSGVEIISCPTCGRCKIDLINIVKKIEEKISLIKVIPGKKLKVAIMGCVVNGPGEAKDADLGVAWGGNRGILFRKGKKVKMLDEDKMIAVLLSEVENEMV